MKKIIGLLGLATSMAHADFIDFTAEFRITNTTGFSSDWEGNSYSALIKTDDSCGANLNFMCSQFNTILDLTIEDIAIGTNANWDRVLFSAMGDYGFGAIKMFQAINCKAALALPRVFLSPHL